LRERVAEQAAIIEGQTAEEHRKARERKRRAECAPGRTQDERGPPKAMAVA